MKETIFKMLKEYDASAVAYVERGEARFVVFHDKYFAIWFHNGTRWNYIVKDGEIIPVD